MRLRFAKEDRSGTGEPPKSLTRMKAVATGLLVGMATIYGISKSLEGTYPLLAWLSAGTEAAMVGALADWFAVVALFRRPLNLPIPRTAVIQKSKDRIAESLANFIKESFLAREVLEKKLRSADVIGWLSRWLSDEKNARGLAEALSTCVLAILRKLEDKELRRFLSEEVMAHLHAFKVSPLLASILGAVTDGNLHQDLLTDASEMAMKLLREHREDIRKITKRHLPFYIPDFIAERIHLKIVESIEEILIHVRLNREHEIRRRVHHELLRVIGDLEQGRGCTQTVENFKKELLEHPRVKHYVSHLWDRLGDQISRDLDDPFSSTREYIQRSIRELGKTLQEDWAVRERLNQGLSSWLAAILHEHRGSLVSLVSETIKKWDPVATSQRIEFHVGKDLQWIRINGTLIGGLAGLLIYSISWLFKNVF